jgi:hypothetical protein
MSEQDASMLRERLEAKLVDLRCEISHTAAPVIAQLPQGVPSGG